MARTAETAERYEDMCKIMRELVLFTGKNEQELTVEERNLLSVAYKNVIGSRRAAWRTLNAGVDEGKFDDLVVAYRKQVEGELSDVCLDVLDLLENTLVKNNVKENEARVFYLKGQPVTHPSASHGTAPPPPPSFAHSLHLCLSLSLSLSVSSSTSVRLNTLHRPSRRRWAAKASVVERTLDGRQPSSPVQRPGLFPSTGTSDCLSIATVAGGIGERRPPTNGSAAQRSDRCPPPHCSAEPSAPRCASLPPSLPRSSPPSVRPSVLLVRVCR